jgi:hypothetical protein
LEGKWKTAIIMEEPSYRLYEKQKHGRITLWQRIEISLAIGNG